MCYFNVRSKADANQLTLYRMEPTTKKWKTEKLKSKKNIISIILAAYKIQTDMDTRWVRFDVLHGAMVGLLFCGNRKVLYAD